MGQHTHHGGSIFFSFKNMIFFLLKYRPNEGATCSCGKHKTSINMCRTSRISHSPIHCLEGVFIDSTLY